MYYISDMYSYGNNNHISSLLSWGNLLYVLLIIYMMMSVIVSVVYDITICKFTSLWSCKLNAYDQTCFPWCIVVMLQCIVFVFWFLLFLWMKLTNLYSFFCHHSQLCFLGAVEICCFWPKHSIVGISFSLISKHIKCYTSILLKKVAQLKAVRVLMLSLFNAQIPCYYDDSTKTCLRLI